MIWNSNLRFNLDDPVYGEAYNHLHSMDRKRYKSCNRVIAVAVNDYFRRESQTECDPYFETREREEKFISEIVDSVGEAVREAIPKFMAAYIMSNAWGIVSAPPTDNTSADFSETEDGSEYIDYSFAGE